MDLVLDKKHIRVQKALWNGVARLDIRELYQDGDEWLPTKKGVSIPIEFTETLIEAIIEVARDEGD